MPDFEQEVIGKTRVIRAVGDMGRPEAAMALAEQLRRYWDSPSVCVVVNWGKITRIKALALVALRTTEDQVTSHGGCVRHCGLSDEHRKLLLFMRHMRDLRDVFETEQEAIDSCRDWERSRAR